MGDRPAEFVVDEAFWNEGAGIGALPAAWTKFQAEIERVLASSDFHPDGPVADRHGSYERAFLRDGPTGLPMWYWLR